MRIWLVISLGPKVLFPKDFSMLGWQILNGFAYQFFMNIKFEDFTKIYKLGLHKSCQCLWKLLPTSRNSFGSPTLAHCYGVQWIMFCLYTRGSKKGYIGTTVEVAFGKSKWQSSNLAVILRALSKSNGSMFTHTGQIWISDKIRLYW